MAEVIQVGRKHCWKRINCSLRAISPFPTLFSKGLFPRGVKRCHCVEWVKLEIVWLIDWMVLYPAFNDISFIWQQLTFMSFLGVTSTRLGHWSVLPKDTPKKRTAERIQCGSNPGPLDYMSNTSLVSHVGLPRDCLVKC